MTLRTKFFLWINTLIALLVLGVGALTIFSEARLIKAEMNQHQTLTVQRLAKVCEESLYQGDVVLFNYFETLKSERGFVSAQFLDSSGKVQATSAPLRAASELNVHSAPVHFAGGEVGTARLSLSNDILRRYVRDSLVKTTKRMGLILLIALLIGVLGAMILAQSMVRPIQEIVSGMEGISQGKLEPIAISQRSDELGWLGREINSTVGKLRELDEMKRNFFSRVTHDLRSPLIGIQGLVSLLLNGQYGTLSEPGREALGDVRNFGTRLSALIDDLLTSAKLEAGREVLDLEDFDVRDAIEEVSRFYAPLAIEKGVSLTLDLPNQPVVARADRDKMHHIVSNLISNAYKFTKKGSVTVRVACEKSDVVVSVSDTGPGIPVNERKSIFECFYRTQSAKNIKGTGLGLFIVKSLVDLHKGMLVVDENPGGGSRFTFTLPRAQNDSRRPLNS